MVAVNFIPWRQPLRKRRMQQNLLYFGLPLMLCLLFSVFAAWRMQALGAQESAIQYQWRQESGTLQKRLQAIKQQRAERDLLLGRWQQKLAEQQRATCWYQRLSVLASSLPASMWLSEIAWKPPHLRITGFALQHQDVTRWQKALLGSSRFSQVFLHQLEQRDSRSLQFVLQLNIADEDV